MTAKDAFAIAFDDDVVTMDAMPSGGSPVGKPKNNAASAGLKKDTAAAPGADKSFGGEKSMAEHLQEGCEALMNGHPERCPYVQKMAKDLESKGVDKKMAMEQAIATHNGAGNNQPIQGNQPQQQAQAPDPALQEQQVNQLAQNPNAALTAPSEMLAQPEVVKTAAGDVTVETTVQKAIVENLDARAASGDHNAENALGEIQDKVEASASENQSQGEENISDTLEDDVIKNKRGDFSFKMNDSDKKFVEEFGERGRKVLVDAAESVRVKNQLYRLNDQEVRNWIDFYKNKAKLDSWNGNEESVTAIGGSDNNGSKEGKVSYYPPAHENKQILKQPEEKKEEEWRVSGVGREELKKTNPEMFEEQPKLLSKDGSYSYELTPEDNEIIAKNPAKKDLLQTMVDLSGEWYNVSDDNKGKDLGDKVAAIASMYYGDELSNEDYSELVDEIHKRESGKDNGKHESFMDFINNFKLGKKQKNDLKNLQKYFPKLTEEEYTKLLKNNIANDELEEAVAYLRQLDDQIERIVDDGGKASGIKKTLISRRNDALRDIREMLDNGGRKVKNTPEGPIVDWRKLPNRPPNPTKYNGVKGSNNSEAFEKQRYFPGTIVKIPQGLLDGMDFEVNPLGRFKNYNSTYDMVYDQNSNLHKMLAKYGLRKCVDLIKSVLNEVKLSGEEYNTDDYKGLNGLKVSLEQMAVIAAENRDEAQKELNRLYGKEAPLLDKWTKDWEGGHKRFVESGLKIDSGYGADISNESSTTSSSQQTTQQSQSGVVGNNPPAPPSPPGPPPPPGGGGGGPGGPGGPPPPGGGGGGGGGGTPPVPPKNPPSGDDDEEDDTPAPRERAPSDEEFRVGKNTYKVGGTTYRDVSGMGTFRGMLQSFIAGLRGEALITGWDRISGAWDAIKRSEKGELVRDGIAAAFVKNTINKYRSNDKLSDVAKMKLDAISQMFDEATSADQKMKAIKAFDEWKKEYAKEIGDEKKTTEGGTFKTLPNNYKGTTPPLSILNKSEGFKADKEFGDKVAADLDERLKVNNLFTEGIAAVNVGPSATTIEFNIPPDFNMSKAKSKAVIDSLKGGIGAEVSSVDYAKGKKNVMAVTITNPEMRNVSFSDVLSGEQWKSFSKSAALPIAIGKDAAGKDTMFDAAKMPQMMVTGATGSGKSVFVASALNSIEMAKTPKEARIVLLDPKNEFKAQDGVPHLLYPRVGGEINKKDASGHMADALESLVSVMNDRVAKIGGAVEGFDPNKNEFSGAAEHNIAEYQKAHSGEEMPYILLVFDEIAYARREARPEDRARIDAALSTLTSVGRSVGINCLLATQRNDVDSIPGNIQGNCPSKLTFKASADDHKATAEAKSLAGNGDYIFEDKSGKKTRGRGCFITEEEQEKIPGYYRDHMDGHEDAPVAPEPPKEGEQPKAPTAPVPSSGSTPKVTVPNIPPVKKNSDGSETVPMAVFYANRGYDWYSNGGVTDINALDKLYETMWKENGSTGDQNDKTGAAVIDVGNGRMAVMVHRVTPSGFDQGGRSCNYTNVAFINAEGLDTPEGKAKVQAIIDQMISMPMEKVSDKNKLDSLTIKPSGVKQSPAPKEGEEKADWATAPDRKSAKEILDKAKKDAIDKAFEVWSKSKRDSVANKAYNRAKENAEEDYLAQMTILNDRFPEELEDGDELADKGNTDTPSPEEHKDEESDEDDETPEKLMERTRSIYKAKKEEIKKKRNAGKLTEKQAHKQSVELATRLKAAEDKFKAGGSYDDILEILEPEEKPAEEEKKTEGTSTTTTSTESPAPAAEPEKTPEELEAEAAEKAAKEEEEKNEHLRNSVQPAKFYNEKTIAGSREATERLTPKEQKVISEKYLPDGWEFVTENGFNAPARDKHGVIFVRNPKNGSHGRIFPDSKNPKGYKFQKDVDTTHPDYKGMVKKPDGSWDLSPEAKKVEIETRRDRKQTKDPKKREEALKRYHRAVFGHDEAPDNKTIISNAVLDALRLMQ